jgi:hypothetical protein
MLLESFALYRFIQKYFSYSFCINNIRSLFKDACSNWGYAESNVWQWKMNLRDKEGIGRGMIGGNIIEVTWSAWEKSRESHWEYQCLRVKSNFSHKIWVPANDGVLLNTLQKTRV